MVDPNHILGSSRVLIYSTAAIKAAVGGVGWCLWLLVAVFAYRRAQRRSNGLFVEVWIACGLGCLATYLQWRFLLDDFPELRSSLSVVLRQTYNYNLLLFLILGVAGFLQYCLIDRNSIQSIACEDQVWLSRLLGLMIMLPMLFVLVVKALNLSRQSFGWLGWIVLASELFSKESLMLLALLLFGLQVVANARNGPAKFNELAAVAHVQLTLTGCILIVLLPLHFAVSQFYFDAVTMLSPKY